MRYLLKHKFKIYFKKGINKKTENLWEKKKARKQPKLKINKKHRQLRLKNEIENKKS